jgi:putative transposase
LYYKPVGEKPENIKMMEIMDKHLMDHPTEGVLSLVLFFVVRHHPVGPKRIRRLLTIMGRQTIYRSKNLRKLGEKEFIKPYLLRGLDKTHVNQIWCTDITYIPMRDGYMYLTTIIDVFSRKIVGWAISNSLTSRWCKEVMEDAITHYDKPEIVNTDQGTQYTSALWT